MSREELIEILEHCMKDDCNGCPNHYTDGHVACDDYMYGMSASMPVTKIQDALALLKEQPEIVRCKDCKNWIAGYITDQDDFIPSKCGKYQQMVGHSNDDFCSLAERR